MLKPKVLEPLDRLRQKNEVRNCWNCQNCVLEDGIYYCKANYCNFYTDRYGSVHHYPNKWHLKKLADPYLRLDPVFDGLGTKNMDTRKCVSLANKRADKSRYILADFLTLKYHIKNNSEINKFVDGDYFEVYTHPIPLKTEVFSWRKLKKIVKESPRYYICKNKQYFYCEDYYEDIEGFIPLDDPISLKELKVFDDIQEAIAFADSFTARANRKDYVVYTTCDELEEKFQGLEQCAK